MITKTFQDIETTTAMTAKEIVRSVENHILQGGGRHAQYELLTRCNGNDKLYREALTMLPDAIVLIGRWA